jgi:hypothetical protein
MTAVIQKLIFWFSIIPSILETIAKVEALIPLPQVGKTKLDLVLAMIHAIYDAEQTIQSSVPWATIEKAVTAAAGSVVSVFKALGIFKSSS